MVCHMAVKRNSQFSYDVTKGVSLFSCYCEDTSICSSDIIK